MLPPRGVLTSSTFLTAAIRRGVAAPRPVCTPRPPPPPPELVSAAFCALCFLSVAISSRARACGDSAAAAPATAAATGGELTGAEDAGDARGLAAAPYRALLRSHNNPRMRAASASVGSHSQPATLSQPASHSQPVQRAFISAQHDAGFSSHDRRRGDRISL